MKIKTKLLFLATFYCITSLNAQKGKDNDKALPSVLPEKEAPAKPITAQSSSVGRGEFEQLAAWIRSPYLNVPVEKATVNDLTIAFDNWEKDHPRKKNDRDKDDNEAKYQRQLYRMQMDNDINEIPIDAHKRLEAFVEYESTNPHTPVSNFNNQDANWRLLGPVSNPEEQPYSDVGGSGEKSLDNSGLGRINCIEFSVWDKRNIWVGTSTGGIWKTWDGGQTWRNISMSLPIMEVSDIAIDQANSNIVYVAVGDRDGRGGWYGNGIGSRLYKTTDGGDNWTLINANFGTGTFIMNLWVHPTRTQEVVVVKTNGIYKSTDGGTTWTQSLITNYTSPFTPPNNLFFMGADYANSGNSDRIYSSYRYRFNANNTAFAFQIQRSDDFGKTWQLMDSVKAVVNDPKFLLNYTKLSICPSDPNCLYIAATEFDTAFRADRLGAIIRSLDGGKTWENRSRYPSIPNTLGWTLGDSSDIGSQVPYTLVFNVDPKNRDKITIGGVDSWGSTDGGKSFNKTTFWLNSLGESAHADHHWGEYQPLTGDYYLATDGGLYKTSNLTPGDNTQIQRCYSDQAYNIFTQDCYKFPTKWDFVGNGISNNEFYAIAVSKSNPSIVMGGTQDNGTLMRRDGKWYSVFGGDGFVSMIHPTNPNIFYSTVYYGQTFRTTDGGKTYSFISYPIDTTDQGAWLTPMEMYEANPNMLFQAREKNLWRSMNAGNTWQRISNFTIGKISNRTYSMAVAPSNSNIIYVARRTQDASTVAPVYYLYQTLDGGTSWKNLWSTAFPNAFLTDIAIHPTQPNKIWVTFSVGYNAANVNQSRKVFYSDNGGGTWTNITEGLPAVPVWSVVVQETNPNDPIYVATGVGVYYKDNTMTKFVEFQGGMPRGVMVTDLKIHSGSGKIFAGTYGRGIWAANLYDQPFEGFATLKTNRSLLLNVYPNPAKDAIKIEWDESNLEGQNMDILDAFGRVIFTQKDFQGRASLNMTEFASGVYTVRLKTGKEVVSKKFILSK